MSSFRAEVTAFRAEVDDLSGRLAAAAANGGARYFRDGATDAAKVSSVTVKRAGLRDRSLLTRRIISSGGVWPTAARDAAAGVFVATVVVGGRGRVNISGRAAVGQVIFGSEFGGQRRVEVIGVRSGRWVKAKGVIGMTRDEQAAGYRALGRQVRQRTRQFRPWEPEGYWLFPALRAADDQLLAAFTAPLDTLTRELARG